MLEEMYFEKGDDKTYDLHLFLRLIPFLKPYILLLSVISLFIVTATATELALPYITKTAVDKYIVFSAQPLKLTDNTSPEAVEIINRNKKYLIDTGLKGQWFLSAQNSHKFDPHHLIKLKEERVLIPARYYLLDAGDEKAAKIINESPALFETYPNVTAITYKNLKSLTKAQKIDLRKKDFKGLTYLSLLAAGIIVLGFIFNFIHIFILEYVGQRFTHDLRQALFGHLLKQSMAFHDDSPTSRLVTRVTNDIQNLSEMIKSVAVTLFKDIFTLVGIAIILISINLPLALVTFTLVPPIALLTIIFRYRARKIFRELRRKLAELNSMLSETISGIRLVQVFNRESENTRIFEKLNHGNYLAGVKQIKIFATFIPCIEFLSVLGLALIIWHGGGSVMSNVMTLGALVAFLSYVQRFFQPMRDLAEKFKILQSALASLERIFQLLDTQMVMEEKEEPISIKQGKGKIEFRNVNFAYNPNEPVLNDLSFTLEPGKKLAIIGATGAGKSSIINLLLRFYDVSSGQVLVDGMDIRDLALKTYRRRIGLVMQDVFIFAGTIRENISMGDENMSQDRIESAARAVKALEFIEALPGGWDHHLEEAGLSLSAGQRQLIAFARTLAQDPEILILDEATSSIDSETEELIDQALEKLMAGRTSIIIAHRLSTIKKAETILVLHQGRIVETGTHDKLMSAQGLYARLYQLQFYNGMFAEESRAELS